MSFVDSKKPFNVLGIETSFDETAIALVSSDGHILFEQLYNQLPLHEKYGGVIPELASRKHIAILPKMIQNSIKNGSLDLKKIDAIAVTSGPGFMGSIIVGVMFAKALAAVLQKPCIPINHLAAHALTAKLTHKINFPYILLLVSGGHTQIITVKSAMQYQVLGGTLDDALGEAFDKIARMMDLTYPGGPAVEKLAKLGNENAFKLPKPMYKKNGCNFSFSGLKTAVKRIIEKEKTKSPNANLEDSIKSDICASFQYTVAEIIYDRLINALKIFKKNESEDNNDIQDTNIILAGGVASNFYIRNFLTTRLNNLNCNIIVPEPKLCTDNGVMISWAGIEIIKLYMSNNNQNNINEISQQFNDLSFKPKSTWPLDSLLVKL